MTATLMGIVQCAQVELDHSDPGDEQPRWLDVSRWDFGKDYEFGRVVRQIATRGWPSNPCMTDEELDRFDCGHCWVSDLSLFELVLQELTVVHVSTQSFVDSLGAFQGLDCRVLFWED